MKLVGGKEINYWNEINKLVMADWGQASEILRIDF
jgi:hypothetical protein